MPRCAAAAATTTTTGWIRSGSRISYHRSNVLQRPGQSPIKPQSRKRQSTRRRLGRRRRAYRTRRHGRPRRRRRSQKLPKRLRTGYLPVVLHFLERRRKMLVALRVDRGYGIQRRRLRYVIRRANGRRGCRIGLVLHRSFGPRLPKRQRRRLLRKSVVKAAIGRQRHGRCDWARIETGTGRCRRRVDRCQVERGGAEWIQILLLLLLLVLLNERHGAEAVRWLWRLLGDKRF